MIGESRSESLIVAELGTFCVVDHGGCLCVKVILEPHSDSIAV